MAEYGSAHRLGRHHYASPRVQILRVTGDAPAAGPARRRPTNPTGSYFSPMISNVWIAQRTAESPAALRARVEEVLAAEPSNGADAPESLVLLGERLLHGIVGPQADGDRQGALDLLAADAAVTWAFEKAADEPATIAARAADAMRRIAAVVR
jgi:hypothetical protein